MTNRERFRQTLSFGRPDRMPVIEWATWWEETTERWRAEEPDCRGDLASYFGLDAHRQFWFPTLLPGVLKPDHFGAPLLENERDYARIRKFLYPKTLTPPLCAAIKHCARGHRRGDYPLWYTVEGAFWFPRRLFGIEGHFYSFYDEPSLYHRMVADLTDFTLSQLRAAFHVAVPDFMTIAEDMSYNSGPMLSEAFFDEFLLPYYRRILPFAQARGTKVFVDTDGDVSKLLPWLLRAGFDGILPLERQAGVDVQAIREAYPSLLMLGGYDKTVMKNGEDAMRAEFRRLLPVIRTGGYICSVDHQTPPDVSVENYRVYVRLLHEYAGKGLDL